MGEALGLQSAGLWGHPPPRLQGLPLGPGKVVPEDADAQSKSKRKRNDRHHAGCIQEHEAPWSQCVGTGVLCPQELEPSFRSCRKQGIEVAETRVTVPCGDQQSTCHLSSKITTTPLSVSTSMLSTWAIHEFEKTIKWKLPASYVDLEQYRYLKINSSQ